MTHADYRDRLEWYDSLFDSAPIRAEGSVQYTMHPVFRGVPERIHNLVPDAKLIYMVRDPVERAISQYIERVAQGYESRTAQEALADPDESRNVYLAASRYATQVRRYLECFPRSALLVLEQAELRDDPESTLVRMFRFLGVDDRFSPSERHVEVRRSSERRKLGPVVGRLRRTRLADKALRLLWYLPPSSAIRIMGALKRPLSSPIERPVLEPALREEMLARFEPEANWLREDTGKEFESWSC